MTRIPYRLLAALWLFALTLAPALRAGEEPEYRYDWVLYYYMAYDNNLEVYGRPILDMLSRGIENERVAVVVSADFCDGDGMKRFVLTRGEERVTAIREEGSAEEETLAKELEWLGRTAPARRYGLVFLDHGGQLAQMSQDVSPGREGGSEWLRVPEVAKVITRWRESIPGKVELLFLQQCGKGTLENYYALRKAAPLVMGSETRVGAPNRYYVETLRMLSEHPDSDGRALAQQIIETEAPDMFTDYAVLDSAALEELPAHLDPVLRPLQDGEAAPKPPAEGAAGPPTYTFDPDERFYDGVALLRAFYAANGCDTKPLEAFEKWAREKLVLFHRVSEQRKNVAGTWCGFSLFYPSDPAAYDRYEKDANYLLLRQDISAK